MAVFGQPSLLRSNTRTTLVSVAIALEAPLPIPTIFMPNLTFDLIPPPSLLESGPVVP
jgi:hypothetical protein